MHIFSKISEVFERKIRRKQAIDSIQNSSGKINHQAKGNWEIILPGKGQLFNRF